MIVLDTSVLVGAVTSPQASLPSLSRAIDRSERILMPALVLYEWLRGPRDRAEIALQEEILPAADALPFGAEEASVAGHLYRSVARPRGREIDLAIASHAIVRGAEVWTLNRRDYSDVPGVLLYEP